MTDTVNWQKVHEDLERARHRMIWRPYGYPEIVDPERSAFFDGSVQPPWDVPEKIIISSAITGAFFTRRANPHQPVTQDEILTQARACAREGASAIHLHVRDEQGYSTVSVDRFREVVDPLRAEFPDLAVDGCLVVALDGEWQEMTSVLDAGIFDAVPINPTAVYTGDALFAKPVPVLLEKTRLILEAGAKPLIAVYVDGDVNNAERYLFRSGLVESPSFWCLLPALPGCSPMGNPRQMVDGLMRMASLIYDVDPEATILVCAAGRASLYLATVAAALGLHIRVGMEDTVWLWPHRDEKVESNMQVLAHAKALAGVLGREVATHADYRRIVGLPARVGAAT
jgi:3-keto-5-aminohexanoate cleavage enzyme